MGSSRTIKRTSEPRWRVAEKKNFKRNKARWEKNECCVARILIGLFERFGRCLSLNWMQFEQIFLPFQQSLFCSFIRLFLSIRKNIDKMSLMEEKKKLTIVMAKTRSFLENECSFWFLWLYPTNFFFLRFSQRRASTWRRENFTEKNLKLEK